MIKERKMYNFYGKRNLFLYISLGIILCGIIVNIILGTELDINFKGGTIFSYNYTADEMSEEELNKLDGVIESACVGVPDPIYGEVVKAFIVGNLTNNDNDKIKTQLTTLIENYKVPVYIEHIA